MQADQVVNLLPEIYRRTLRQDGALRALLDAMDQLQSPSEYAVANFPEYLNPRTTPDDFVPLLMRWMDLDHLFASRIRRPDLSADDVMPTGLGRLRELVANAAVLSDKRGTAEGLALFLKIATGIHDFVIEEHLTATGEQRPFHLCVAGPSEAEQYRILIEDIIRSERPAHLTFEFVTTTKDEGHGDNH